MLAGNRVRSLSTKCFSLEMGLAPNTSREVWVWKGFKTHRDNTSSDGFGCHGSSLQLYWDIKVTSEPMTCRCHAGSSKLFYNTNYVHNDKHNEVIKKLFLKKKLTDRTMWSKFMIECNYRHVINSSYSRLKINVNYDRPSLTIFMTITCIINVVNSNQKCCSYIPSRCNYKLKCMKKINKFSICSLAGCSVHNQTTEGQS